MSSCHLYSFVKLRPFQLHKQYILAILAIIWLTHTNYKHYLDVIVHHHYYIAIGLIAIHSIAITNYTEYSESITIALA